MGKLDRGRLRFAQVEFILEMFVHYIDHSVANSPEQEQGAHQDESKHYVSTIICYEETFFFRGHVFWSSGMKLTRDQNGIGVLDRIPGADQADTFGHTFLEFNMWLVLQRNTLERRRKF